MQFAEIPGATHRLGKPKEWNEAEHGPCGTLPVRVELDPGTGMPVIYSQWKPDAIDLAILNAGGVIQLGIVGNSHPPVSMGVDVSRDIATDAQGFTQAERDEYAYRNDPERRAQQTPEEEAYGAYVEALPQGARHLTFEEFCDRRALLTQEQQAI